VIDDLEIRPIAPDEPYPWPLLLLADPERAMVEAYLGRGRCYVAYLDGELIGEFVLAEKFVLAENGEGHQELMNIAVAETRQGQGWGKRLVLAAIAEARNLGASRLDVATGNSSLAQLALYQKCGFRIVGVVPDYFTQHYEDEIYENGIRCIDQVRLSLSLKD
jgi:ribosomal protein S18 acetylase RimI-like enzyme